MSADTAAPDVRGFLAAVEARLHAFETAEASARKTLTDDIGVMFAVMEPAVAAATLAARVVERRLAAGRDRRTAANFSSARLAVTRELDLSRIFAHLLDPAEEHAQGTTFMTCLLDELRLVPPRHAARVGALRQSVGSVSSVQAEHTTASGRLDILIEFEDGRRIAIENKPWTGDQPDQVGRYLNDLQALAREQKAGNGSAAEFLVLYWSGGGGDPSVSRVGSGTLMDRCITMPYRDSGTAPSVEGWLRRCSVQCEAPRVRSFVTDLIQYVRREFRTQSTKGGI